MKPKHSRATSKAPKIAPTPASVYPAESDPRQTYAPVSPVIPKTSQSVRQFNALDFFDSRGTDDTSEALAREFGPWVRGEDGRWMRDRAAVRGRR